jgi:RNA-directed DNA polymerase
MKKANDAPTCRNGAASDLGKQWESINWTKVRKEVKRLQMRIAQAEKENKPNKVRALQWILSHSFSAKLLAVKKVTTNKGSKTAGIDGVIWNTSAKRMGGTLSLKRKGYKALPLRRKFINKRNGKKRPLGISTIRDRAMQALYLLTLEPIAETNADPNSYGFRLYRACRDAIGQCFCVLAKSYAPKWILDADIKACFDGIKHKWLLDNIPIDKRILRQWLKCGFIQDKQFSRTIAGTPQGGIISPTLMNMTLDGLEKVIKSSCPKRRKVNFIRYADDFIVTADCKELIKDNIIPTINSFLKERGLELSKEKTKIVHIEQGFDFLGQHLQKYNNKLLIISAKKDVKDFLERVRRKIKMCLNRKSSELIKILNPMIRGWCYYHRYVQSWKTFYFAKSMIFQSLWTWAKRRHQNKSGGWIKRKYFNHPRFQWVFSAYIKQKDGSIKLLELLLPSFVKCVQYIKIKGHANPFDPEYAWYFAMRRKSSNFKTADNLTVGLS